VRLARPSAGEDQQPPYLRLGCVRESSASVGALSETATGALVCHGSDARLRSRPSRIPGNVAFGDERISSIRPAVCSSGYRHQRRNRSHHAGRAAGSIAATPTPFQNQPHSSKVLIMPPTEVAAPVFAPAAPTFTQAAVRFVISFTALIGLSLLLAGL
jgi:hypothetical protein